MTEHELRLRALQMAAVAGDTPSTILWRAEQYLSFLRGPVPRRSKRKTPKRSTKSSRRKR